MGKKKNKKRGKSISILNEVDKTLNGTYDNIMEEIKDMQLKLYMADEKAIKKVKKGKKRRNQYDIEKVRRETRKELVKSMEGNNFLDRTMKILKELSPIIVVIGRLVASLILAILSIDAVKVWIKPETLSKMNIVYQKAMAIC